MPADPLAPPRAELLALLDAVKDYPDDDTPRLVLADWLDEQDNELDAERAKFIRKDIVAHHELQIRNWTREEAEEAQTLLPRWLGPVMDLACNGDFHRGLPTLWVNGPRFLKADVPKLLASEAFAFVQYVRVEEAGGPRMEAMANMPEFRFVPGVSLHPFSAFGADSAARFFASPNVTGLRQIEFRSVKPGAVGMQALAKNPALSRLRKLNLAHNKLVDKAVAVFAEAKHLTNLTHLDLSDNNIGDKGAEALAAAAKTLTSLRELGMWMNPRLSETGKKLLRDAFGDRVKLS
jgi:uncharacterized protein (TIGR02996 family)